MVSQQDTHVNVFQIRTRKHRYPSGVAVSFGDVVTAFFTTPIFHILNWLVICPDMGERFAMAGDAVTPLWGTLSRTGLNSVLYYKFSKNFVSEVLYRRSAWMQKGRATQGSSDWRPSCREVTFRCSNSLPMNLCLLFLAVEEKYVGPRGDSLMDEA